LLPLVSIITACYNKESYIAETIESVHKQTFKNWELIIIDDVSNDGTVKIINEFITLDSRIKLNVNSENKGANYCRNIAINAAKGTYIIFLDADDILTSSCIENRLKIIEQDSFDFCVFTMGVFVKEIGDSHYLWRPNSKKPLEDFLQHKLPWSILQPIWRKEFLVNLQGFDESFKRMQDVDLHTRALLVENVKFKQFDENPDCFYRIDEERKNFDANEFLKRRVESSILYYLKFNNVCKEKCLSQYLLGTIYSTYLQLLYQYKIKSINDAQFEELEKILLNSNEMLFISNFNKKLFKIGKFFSLLPLRLPGINFLINKMLIEI
jgi:glycosyltransferase involved in cell wall biosynthesis